MSVSFKEELNDQFFQCIFICISFFTPLRLLAALKYLLGLGGCKQWLTFSVKSELLQLIAKPPLNTLLYAEFTFNLHRMTGAGGRLFLCF